MLKVIQEHGEDRKDYLIRVAIRMLEESGYDIDSVEYDEAECDAFCLAADLTIEFNITEEF
jgi:hypothetical protein